MELKGGKATRYYKGNPRPRPIGNIRPPRAPPPPQKTTKKKKRTESWTPCAEGDCPMGRSTTGKPQNQLLEQFSTSQTFAEQEFLLDGCPAARFAVTLHLV